MATFEEDFYEELVRRLSNGPRQGRGRCVFCGDSVPNQTREEVLAHVLACPGHPMRELEIRLGERAQMIRELRQQLERADLDDARHVAFRIVPCECLTCRTKREQLAANASIITPADVIASAEDKITCAVCGNAPHPGLGCRGPW